MRNTNPYQIYHLRKSDSEKFNLCEEFWNLASPPSEIFVQGQEGALSLLHKLPERGLAVVGTRRPHPRSTVATQKYISALSGSNLVILSGLARGIDTIAHTAALEAGLPTIAILGAGLDLDYPKENHTLRKKILAAGGLVISEFPWGTPALGHHFLRRNRLIAGWSKATWVIEAGHPSGALSTARWAREQNRTCFAIPCYPDDPTLAGNQTLLDRDHALAFWGVHSLGAAWIEFASHTRSKDDPPSSLQKSLFSSTSPPESDDRILTQKVRHLTHERGGAQVQELLNWAVSNDWSAQRFFLALQSAVHQHLVIDQGGTLISM